MNINKFSWDSSTRYYKNTFIFQQPFRCEIEHKLGVSCMNSGPVSCRVSLDRGGYVAGETIGISAIIVNKSKVTIKSTKASLTEVSVGQKRGSLKRERIPMCKLGVADHTVHGQRQSHSVRNEGIGFFEPWKNSTGGKRRMEKRTVVRASFTPDESARLSPNQNTIRCICKLSQKYAVCSNIDRVKRTSQIQPLLLPFLITLSWI